MAKRKKQIRSQSPPPGSGKRSDAQFGGKSRRAGKGISTAQVANPVDPTGKQFVWSARRLDHDYYGEWDWNLTPQELCELMKFIEAQTKRTWGEIMGDQTGGRKRHKKHHAMQVKNLSRAARERVTELYASEIPPEQLFRFRLSGLVRLWGTRTGNLFEILWYDREHKVYPVEKP